MADDAQLIARLAGTVAADPEDGNAWTALGSLLRRAGRLEEAVACHRRGIEAAPWDPAIWTNLGNALVDAGRIGEGLAAHAHAVALSPLDPALLFNQVVALRQAGRYGEALAAIGRALAARSPQDGPAPPHLVWERALARLQLGDFAGGFEDYEARRQVHADRLPPQKGPAWDGGPLEGRTILLTAEQGFGDTILAARYVPLVKARGGRVLLECHPELRRLLSGVGADLVLAPGEEPPAYDVAASLMSLPRLCGTGSGGVPAPVRVAVPEAARRKAVQLVGGAGALKVGIVWSGRVTFQDNHRRAASLSRFLRFAEVPGVRLYSLQKGPPEAELAALGSGGSLVVPLGPHLDDFADTAAVVERLDLVVMTDSAVAHLAGSMGRPVWNLVQHVPYWIYGAEGDGTPWYPSMRLFRQGPARDWDPVFAAAAQALEARALSRPGQG